MQKQITKFEIKKGERIYQLLLESDSPLGEVYDVLYEMRSHVVNSAERALKQDARPEKIEEELSDAGQ